MKEHEPVENMLMVYEHRKNSHFRKSRFSIKKPPRITKSRRFRGSFKTFLGYQDSNLEIT